MQVGRHRRGRGHGLGQPEVEGELRALGEAAHEDEPQRQGIQRVRLDLGTAREHGRQIVGAGHLAQHDDARQHDQPAPAGDGQRHARTGPGLFSSPPVADEQERGDAGQFPEHHQQQQVVRQHDAQHRRHEQHQRAEELARRVLGVQVVGRVQDDEQPDARDQAREHQAQCVQAEVEVQADRGDPLGVVQQGAPCQHLRRQGQQHRQSGAGHARRSPGRELPPKRRGHSADAKAQQGADHQGQQDDEGQGVHGRADSCRPAGFPPQSLHIELELTPPAPRQHRPSASSHARSIHCGVLPGPEAGPWHFGAPAPPPTARP